MVDGVMTARRIVRVAVLPFIIALLTIVSPIRSWAGAEITFPRPVEAEPNVQFWIKVFSQFGYRDFIVHDRGDLTRVYQVMHLPGYGEPGRADVDWTNDYLKAKYSTILNRLASGAAPASFEERNVAALFHNPSPQIYAMAAQNLRVQQGLREQFRDGLLRSRYYRHTMERIFHEAGVPVELVTLAEVESGFYPKARSSAGALGIWQFTRGTGRQYMKINSRYDERLNPVRETEAAAKLLRYNHDVLGDWPLAITAYNYGTGGTARAAQLYDNNYGRIFKNFDGPHFGFAARNYYPEFLAAMQVYRHENDYFPGIENASIAPPPETSPVIYHPRHLRRASYHVRKATYHRHVRSCTGRCTVAKHTRRVAARRSADAIRS